MKLKLCPMCGGEAGHAQPEVTCVGVLYGNFCKVCTLSLTGFETQQSADKAWNNRPGMEPLHDLADEMKKEIYRRRMAREMYATPEEWRMFKEHTDHLLHLWDKLRKALKQMEGK